MTTDADATTAEAVEEELSLERFGKVIPVEERFLGYPFPPERFYAVFFFLLFAGFTGLLYYSTMEQRAFDATRVDGTIASFRSFVTEWPEGEFRGQAERTIDNLSWKAHRSASTYQAYLDAFPKGLHRQAAKDSIEDALWEENHAAQTWAKYIEAYPEGRYVQRGEREIENLRVATFRECVKTCLITADPEGAKLEEHAGPCCTQCTGLWTPETGTCATPPPPGATPEGVPGAPGGVPGAPGGVPGAPGGAPGGAPAAPAPPAAP